MAEKLGLSGSSPLTRGKPLVTTGSYDGNRLIPAHAGKTRGRARLADHPRAHPRSRGENSKGRDRLTPSSGSSPLTRGKPPGGPPGEVGAGLIPAHAGKTRSRAKPSSEYRAHPRSRGENLQVHPAGLTLGGSSPLTRGKPVNDERAEGHGGLIPAHAGKTRKRTRPPRRPRAHPRSRGENVVRPGATILEPGSSPLTRGKLAGQERAANHLGLIPAHAGKTSHPTGARRNPEAHPRSRGENRR